MWAVTSGSTKSGHQPGYCQSWQPSVSGDIESELYVGIVYILYKLQLKIFLGFKAYPLTVRLWQYKNAHFCWWTSEKSFSVGHD